MGSFASGKNAYAISDRSGFRYRYKDMRKEWNGLLVGKDEFEAKQPQLGPFRTVSDPQALQDARPQTPDRTSVFQVITTNGIIYLGNGNWSTSGTAEMPTSIPASPSMFGQVGLATLTISNVTGVSVDITGVSGSSSSGSVTVLTAGTAPRFDSTSITLDSTTDTFDEG